MISMIGSFVLFCAFTTGCFTRTRGIVLEFSGVTDQRINAPSVEFCSRNVVRTNVRGKLIDPTALEGIDDIASCK